MVQSDPVLTTNGPRRTALAQDRSKATRRRLVRAALRLWTERGFEHGIEDTTVDEIVQEAGVTKGTFYFHFAHKEDILLELGWATAEAMYDEAVKATNGRRSGLAVVRHLMVSLAKRVEPVGRAAVMRSVAGFWAHGVPRPAPGRLDIHQAFGVALDAARSQGEIPDTADTEELARVMAALAMDALYRWSRGDRRRLRPVLLARAEVVFAGAQQAPRPLPALRAP